jgi:hypothetical protein
MATPLTDRQVQEIYDEIKYTPTFVKELSQYECFKVLELCDRYQLIAINAIEKYNLVERTGAKTFEEALERVDYNNRRFAFVRQVVTRHLAESSEQKTEPEPKSGSESELPPVKSSTQNVRNFGYQGSLEALDALYRELERYSFIDPVKTPRDAFIAVLTQDWDSHEYAIHWAMESLQLGYLHRKLDFTEWWQNFGPSRIAESGLWYSKMGNPIKGNNLRKQRSAAAKHNGEHLKNIEDLRRIVKTFKEKQ